MAERLRRHDLALLAFESPRSPMHNATVEVFDPGDSGFDYDALVRLIDDRISFVPRYRQQLGFVPGRLANPVWVDDPDFDLTFHVRRSALPRPGSIDQLRDLVGRIVSRPLDRSRPLWEVYLIEGLDDGRVAILSKSHQVLVDGVETVDLGQVLLDVTDEHKELIHDDWTPHQLPSGAGLVAGAVKDLIEDPVTAVTTAAGNLEAALLKLPALPFLPARYATLESALNTELSEQRRILTIRTDLEDYRRVRHMHGCTVNDVILATVTGALRAWLMTRGDSMGSKRSLRAVVPMSVIDDELEPTSLGSQVASHFVDLPIGEASAVIRLHQVSYAFKAHSETGQAVAANRLAGIAGFAPTTFHALGARVASTELRKGFHLSITNVPGPQFPLYADGARMLESYPVHPLLPGHALAIGVTSYDGRVFYGITADRDALPDVDVFAQCLTEALDELVDSASSSRQRAPRGRKRVEKKVDNKGEKKAEKRVGKPAVRRAET